MELEFDTIYRPGFRTFFYLWGNYGWWLTGLFLLFGWVAMMLYWGPWHAPAEQYLAQAGLAYLGVATVAQWAAMISFSFLLVAFLRVSVMYRRYSFYLDGRAFHLRRGIFRVEEITIPYHQISNVHIDQPYLWRLQGLAKLDITVNNANDNGHPIRKHHDFLIPCIDKPRAKALSTFLIHRAAGEDDAADMYDEYDEYDDEDDGEDYEVEQDRNEHHRRQRSGAVIH